MATQEALLRRLRRLIDDTGHGYSQSAPGFSTNLSALVAPIAIGIQIDADATPSDISLGSPASLTTGQAIAAALQAAIRAADPALPDGNTPGYQACNVTFSRQDGYVIRSGSIGSISRVRVLAPSAGTDCSGVLKLGQPSGGYESSPRLELSDEELGALMDEALANQNTAEASSWAYDTLPASRETIVAYRAWASVVDIKLGQSANYFWQKVEAEEAHEENVFSNYLKLADWLKDKIEEMAADLAGSSIEVSTVSRWDYQSQQHVPVNTHKDQSMRPAIAAVSWLNATTALLEFTELLATGFVEINVGYKPTNAGVIDRSVYNDPNYETLYAATKGFVSPAVLARTLKNGRNTFVKLTGLDSNETHYFAVMAVDLNGIRYFSPEVKLLAIPT